MKHQIKHRTSFRWTLFLLALGFAIGYFHVQIESFTREQIAAIRSR